MQMRPDNASFSRALRAELPPAPFFEARSAAVLCYQGGALQDVAEPFHMLVRMEREEHAAYEVALLGSSAGMVHAAGGAMLRADHGLDTGVPDRPPRRALRVHQVRELFEPGGNSVAGSRGARGAECPDDRTDAAGGTPRSDAAA